MTISARYIRRAKIRHRCECGRRIEPGHGYLYLYGHADDGTPPFAVCVCEACIKADLLPSLETRTGYAWKDKRLRAALERYTTTTTASE